MFTDVKTYPRRAQICKTFTELPFAPVKIYKQNLSNITEQYLMHILYHRREEIVRKLNDLAKRENSIVDRPTDKFRFIGNYI